MFTRHVGRRSRPTRWSAALWPNDGDGNAWGDTERGFPPALPEAGLHARSTRAATRTSPTDFTAQINAFKTGERRDRHRRADPARLDDLLEAGQAAGLHAQGRLGRQGAAVPRLGGGARRRRRRPVHRGVVEPEPPVLELAHRRDAARSWPTPTRRPRGSSGRSRSASSTRCSRSPLDALNRAGEHRDRPPCATPSRRPTSTPSSARSSGGPSPVPKNVAKTPLVGGQWRRARAASSPTTWSSCRNKDHPDIPAAGTLRPIPGS